MRFIIITLFLATQLFAQTKPTATQLRSQRDNKTYVLIFQNGRAVLAQLGTGFNLDLTTNPPTIALMTTTIETIHKLTRNSDGTWQLPTACSSPRIFRNGLFQFSGEDYTIASNTLRFRNGVSDSIDPSLPDDLILALCR